LTDKQSRFVEEYLVDLNATQAAIRAGYSPKTAQVIAAENLSKPMIAQAIQLQIEERSRRTEITQDRVLNELAKIGFLNIADILNMDDATVERLSREDAAAIASMKVRRTHTEAGDVVEREVKICDKLKALELLGRHVGLFDTRVQVSGAVPVTIIEDL